MIDLQSFTLKRVEESETEGKFVISPLPRGYGYTVGNALRRILLSSIEGGAITSIKLVGVDHEYSTLDGVQDDILALILKLKGVVIRCYSDEPVVGRIEVTAKKGGVAQVTAGDIDVDASVEIINKDYVITSLSDGNSLRAELIIEKGVGFIAADSSKRSEIGVIPVDAVFGPVENVQIKISNARVGQKTDLDQIDMTIKTNGAMTATEALQQALEINKETVDRLVELAQGDMTGVSEAEEESEVIVEEELKEGISIDNLNLSTRLRNALTNSAITDLTILSGKSRDELLEIRGMGQKSVDELVDVMREHNLEVVE